MHCYLFFLLFPLVLLADLLAGVGKADLTPPPGIPSAGYRNRKGAGMAGTHDPLLAIALVLDNGKQPIAFCSVDHLGFTYEMAQEVAARVKKSEGLAACELFIGSSHTHSGGGAFLNIPIVGEMLAGRFDPEITEMYVQRTAEAIVDAWENRVPAKAGIGYGTASGMARYRASWPPGQIPLNGLSLIKVETAEGAPLAALFNFALHPTVLSADNLLFSADFVGFARNALADRIGRNVQPLYFNGAQGDIDPDLARFKRLGFTACEEIGTALAQAAFRIWNSTAASDKLDIAVLKLPYAFEPKPNPQGLRLPVEEYKSEMGLLVLNRNHAFLAIPGELSTVYDRRFKELGKKLGYAQVSILGLTNDAHGYIILPDSWRRKTFESNLSFGGESYGEETEQRALFLLERLGSVP